MSVGSDSSVDGRQFQWGGYTACFFREEGVYRFGDIYQWRASIAFILFFLILFITVQFAPLFKLDSLTSVYVEIGEAAVGMPLLFVWLVRKYGSKKAHSKFASDINFQELFDSQSKPKFYPWAKIYLVRSESVVDKHILRVFPRKRFAFVASFSEPYNPETLIGLEEFLYEKLGDKFRSIS